MNLEDEHIDLLRSKAHSISPCGRLIHVCGCLRTFHGWKPLVKLRAVAFSPCGTWVVGCTPLHDSKHEFRVYRVSDLLEGVLQPFYINDAIYLTRALFTSSTKFVCLIEEAASWFLYRGTIGAEVHFERLTQCSHGVLTVVNTTVAVGSSLFTLNGEPVAQIASELVPVTLQYAVHQYKSTLHRLNGTYVCNFLYQPNVLRSVLLNIVLLRSQLVGDYINLVLPGVTWNTDGLSLITTEGKFSLKVAAVAKLLRLSEKWVYLLQRVFEISTEQSLGAYDYSLETLLEFLSSMWASHERALEALDTCETALGSVSGSQALAALEKARFTVSDEPALAQELPTALVSSLCEIDRIAFRHHEPDACKRVNSVLDLVCATADKPSDPWCSEEAVNLALSQCGKPAAHAQRAAFRLGVELRDGLLVPRFRKLAMHTSVTNYRSDPVSIAEHVFAGDVKAISPSGEYIFLFTSLYSTISGTRLVGNITSASFSPCGHWLIAQFCQSTATFSLWKIEHENAHFVSIGDMELTCFAFASNGYIYALGVGEAKGVYRGEINPTGCEWVLVLETSGYQLTVIDDHVYVNGHIYDLELNLIGQYINYKGEETIPITHALMISTVSRRYSPLCTLDGRRVAKVDIISDSCLSMFNSRFLRPSVLADYIKLVDERITWSDKGISLPTVDGKTFTFWWEPVAKLCAAGL